MTLAQLLPALTSGGDVALAALVFGMISGGLVLLGIRSLESLRRSLQFGRALLSTTGLLAVFLLAVTYLAPCGMQVIRLSGDSVEMCPYGERAR